MIRIGLAEGKDIWESNEKFSKTISGAITEQT